MNPEVERATRCVIPPLCNSTLDRTRCVATVLLIAPDGGPVPGGYYCRRHAALLVREYLEKADEVWTTVPLTITDGRTA